ncbi:hypothetical protein RJT34_01112 [Clitoria ternatea]|uniref:Non-haem dioxygenase N-terminal domain-containing protein n=1 Tax=Clitoria ternatea TaxID=43366 RepID=A0AAN9PZN4_CLITE
MSMASVGTISSTETEPPKVHASDISSIKAFAELNGASVIPSTYHSITEPHDDVAEHLASSIPLIDLSLLTSCDPQIHAKAVHELSRACAQWGLFMSPKHSHPSHNSYLIILNHPFPFNLLVFFSSVVGSALRRFAPPRKSTPLCKRCGSDVQRSLSRNQAVTRVNDVFVPPSSSRASSVPSDAPKSDEFVPPPSSSPAQVRRASSSKSQPSNPFLSPAIPNHSFGKLDLDRSLKNVGESQLIFITALGFHVII